MPKQRFVRLDTIRGWALLSMILYHGSWDLVYMFGVNWPWYHGFAAYVWQQSICWTFILLSGFCFSLGSKPLRRGLEVFGGGLAVTAVTLLLMPEDRIVFGVLTLLGSCMLLMVPLDRFLERISPWLGLMGSGVLFWFLRHVNQGLLGRVGPTTYLASLPKGLYRNLLTAFLGFPPADFFSTDYFSLAPWFFLFLAGYYINRLWRQHRPIPAGGSRIPVLSELGRYSLPVYLVHQPVVYGVLWAFSRL